MNKLRLVFITIVLTVSVQADLIEKIQGSSVNNNELKHHIVSSISFNDEHISMMNHNENLSFFEIIKIVIKDKIFNKNEKNAAANMHLSSTIISACSLLVTLNYLF